MADITSSANPLFLREEELRLGIELLFYAYRDFTAEPDAILAKYRFGRAHHRVIYFVGRNPGITVSELLGILRITKQSLSRVLGHLVREAFITQRRGTRDGLGGRPAVPGEHHHPDALGVQAADRLGGTVMPG